MRRFSGLSSSFLSALAWPGLVLTLAVGAGACGLKLGGGGGGSGGSDGAHALGTVVIAESHAPSGGTSTPLVEASFVPDASAVAVQTCSTQIGGCDFVSTPQCGGSGSSCGEGEACTWDSACSPTCAATCTLGCATGQECYFVSPGLPACRPMQTFDAGVLAVAGTTTPITLFPPYAYQANGTGAPFLAGAQLEVQASGATGAGFGKFDHKVTATTFLQTSPALDSISATVVFGTGSIPVSWAAGSDTIRIAVSGVGGTATCTATDASGSFSIPRAAVNAALGANGTSTLAITVTRERDDWFKGESTHGALAGATVQPVGWLEVSTESAETASFQGCAIAGETMCPDGCFDTPTDPDHCGGCSTVCSASQTCDNGQCVTGATGSDCTTCQTSADTGTCASSFTTCGDSADCVNYGECVGGCVAGDTTCLSECESAYPDGFVDYESYVSCICTTACVAECASTSGCGG
jgi:hypothetical protein